MASFIQPLDLQTIFQGYFAGTALLFAIILIIFVGYLASRMKMNSNITFIMILLLATLLAPFLPFFEGFRILLYIVIAAIVLQLISEITKK